MLLKCHVKSDHPVGSHLTSRNLLRWYNGKTRTGRVSLPKEKHLSQMQLKSTDTLVQINTDRSLTRCKGIQVLSVK